MKKFIILLVGVLCISFTGKVQAQTQAPSTPVQFSLFDPVQWPDNTHDVKGVSLGLVYSAKNNMTGVDLINGSKITGDLKGVHWGLFSVVDGHMTGWQESLWSTVEGDVKGLQGGLLYSRATNVKGLQGSWGLAMAEGDFVGLQGSFIASIVQGKMTGWQSGLYAKANDLTGLQTAAVCMVDETLVGVQFGGIYNYAGKVKGLQFGLVNVTENLAGLQIGLINVNKKGDPFKFFPIANFSTKW